MRQRRERAHASYTARKNKLEKAERADEAAAEIEVPEDDVPDPERSTLSLALSAVALRAQAQYHSLGAAIETDLAAARRAEEAAFEADRGAFVLNRRVVLASEVAASWTASTSSARRSSLGCWRRRRSTRSGGGARRGVPGPDFCRSAAVLAARFPLENRRRGAVAAGRGTKGGGGDRDVIARFPLENRRRGADAAGRSSVGGDAAIAPRRSSSLDSPPSRWSSRSLPHQHAIAATRDL